MQKNSTPELLVKHLYNETTNSEVIIVENALNNNYSLHEEFKQMLASKIALDDADGNEPNKSVITNILDYSKKMATQMA